MVREGGGFETPPGKGDVPKGERARNKQERSRMLPEVGLGELEPAEELGSALRAVDLRSTDLYELTLGELVVYLHDLRAVLEDTKGPADPYCKRMSEYTAGALTKLEAMTNADEPLDKVLPREDLQALATLIRSFGKNVAIE